MMEGRIRSPDKPSRNRLAVVRHDPMGVSWGANRFPCAFKILVQQVVKCMRRAVPVQDLPGPIVEHHLHPFDLRM